jgi:G3E family GTPase
VVVRPTGELDPDRFFRWLNSFVQARGSDVLRLKGIVALVGERRRYVFHGVHMTLDGRPGRPWQVDEARQGEIVFIGRRLDRESLLMQVEACLADSAQG